MYQQLHDPAFLAVASGGTPALDLFFSATKALDSRITFSRGSSGTFINENGNIVGKTPGTTSSITPSTTAIGSQVTVTVASGSVVGWAVGQTISLIVDTDGQDDPDAGELWLLGDIVSSTLTTLTFTVTSRTATAGSATSWTLGYRGARFTHDPVTLRSLGLLIEDSRTNIIFPSIPTGTNLTLNGATLSLNQAISPDGSSNATRMTSSSTSQARAESYQFSNSVAYVISAYVKYETARYVGFGRYLTTGGVTSEAAFDLLNGTTVSVRGTEFSNSIITSVGGGWYRILANFTSAGSGSGLKFHVSNSSSLDSNSASGISALYWGIQLEAGAFATSYIPTTSATVTRAADVATMTGTNFSSWYNSSEGTFAVAYRPQQLGIYQQILQVDNGTGNNRAPSLAHGISNFARLDWSSGGTTQISNFLASGSISLANTLVATSYKIGVGGSIAANGTVNASATAITTPTVDRLVIGNRSATNAYLNAPIARIRYYRRRLPDANLQTLTT